MGGLVFVGAWRLWGRSRGGFLTGRLLLDMTTRIVKVFACIETWRWRVYGIRYIDPRFNP